MKFRLAWFGANCHAGGVKAVLPVAILMLALFPASGAIIPSAEAGANVGKTGVVSGTVAQVSKVGDLTFLNFGRPHPDSEFTAVIKGDASAYGDLASLQGKAVEVEGTIDLHKGRPQIVLTSPQNLREAGTASATESVSSTASPSAPPAPNTPSSPAQVIPLDAVADYVGKTVTIVDTVKAISSSPRSGIRYLNFGDAYPRQKLSAKIAKDQKELRELSGGTLGLQVRVTGVVESGKDGPAITLTSPDQLQIIEDDSIDLLALSPPAEGFFSSLMWKLKSWFNAITGRSNPPQGPYANIPHEGEAFGQLLNWKLEKLLREGKYEELEKIAAAWRKPEARMLDGRWNLFVFYNSLASPTESTDEGFAEARRKLEDWRAKRPQAIEPVILLADLERAYAWHARGGGWAHTVTDEGWRLMGERLDKAKSLLDSVYDRRLECPQWVNTMQSVALGQGWPDDKVKSMLDEAIAAWPEYWLYYFSEARRLLPRWGGSPGEWEKFSRSFPGDLGKELSARIPWAQQWAYWNLFRDTDIPWSQMKEGFERMVQRYPESTRTKSAFAVFAGMADDRETCKRLLDELGDKVNMEFWISWQNVELAKAWIADPNHPPLAIFKLTDPPPKDDG
jgi:DNA/RNA endonuclease YhcR with UshA esterase domain